MPEPIQQVQRAFTAYTIERELGAGGMVTVVREQVGELKSKGRK